LDDRELCALQQQAFDTPLSDEEAAALKKEVSKSFPGAVRNNGLTFAGLLGIMSTFIARAQQQTPWTVLHRFGYDDALRLEVRPSPVIQPWS
jgi:hypothetical protein